MVELGFESRLSNSTAHILDHITGTRKGHASGVALLIREGPNLNVGRQPQGIKAGRKPTSHFRVAILSPSNLGDLARVTKQ